jgi:hypothetical protein
MIPTCRTCRFWDGGGYAERHEDIEGQCRRHAPRTQSHHLLELFGRMLWALEAQANLDTKYREEFDHLNETEHYVDVRWPKTSSDETCGEHRPITAADIDLAADQRRYDYVKEQALEREKRARK